MQREILQSNKVDLFLKLDPRTKLVLLLIINIVLVGGNITGAMIYVKTILAFIPCILLITGKRWISAIIYFIVYSFSILLEIFFVYNTVGILNIIIVCVSGLISRMLPGVIMGYYLVSTTRVSEFVAAMKKVNVSDKIIIPLSVMFRFFPTVLEEFKAIGDAMKMRGISFRTLIKNPITLLEYRLVPLMMSVVKIGDELSASAISRGLGSPIVRTNICSIGFKIQDYILLFLGIICFFIFIQV